MTRLSEPSFIPGWYAILPSSKLVKSKPLALSRFGLQLVLWRTMSGVVYSALDRCPHRGAKLSIGKLQDNCLECPYHGFKFDTDGACRYAPEFDKPLPGLKLIMFETKESMGMIWLYYGDNPTPFEFQALIKLHDNFAGAYSETSSRWYSHISYCIENQLDYAHLPSVHKNTIGRGFDYPQDPSFDLSPERIAISFRRRKNISEYYFPNVWVLNTSDKMKVVVYFSPIDHENTRLYLRAYNPILKFKLSRLLLAPLFNKLNLIILKQDQRVVKTQGVLPSFMADRDVLMKNDKAIRYFRERWQASLSQQESEG